MATELDPTRARFVPHLRGAAPQLASALTAKRLPSLDGWRAVSIAMVLGAHSMGTAGFPPALAPAFQWLSSGTIGVRFFFVISGFLITWLLAAERERTGEIDLRAFYRRRCCRILPVYFAYLLVLGVLQLFTAFRLSPSVWLNSFTFTINFVDAPWPAAHLWSLSVEEQFYLLWPPIVAGCAVATRRFWYVLAVPLLLAPLCRTGAYLGIFPSALAPFFSYHSFFCHFDALAVGCGFAALLRSPRSILGSAMFACPRWVVFGIAALMIILPHASTQLRTGGIIAVPLGPTLQASGFALLLVQSVLFPEWRCYRLLNWPVVQAIGVLSYSIYIWQQIFCSGPGEFGWKSAWWTSFPGWLVPVFCVAWLSYRWIEKPLLRFRAGR